MSTERRRAPRAPTLGRVRGRIVSLEAQVEIREISLGGMSLVSEILFPEGAVHQFELMLGDGARVAVSARARHSREMPGDGKPRYITGFQFLDDEGDADSSGVLPIVQTLR